jgi:hypothetical protein
MTVRPRRVSAIIDEDVNIQGLDAYVLYGKSNGSLRFARIPIQLSCPVEDVIDKILYHFEDSIIVDDHWIYVQTPDQGICQEMDIDGIPREFLNPNWEPRNFIMPYPACNANTVRGLHALGVDQELPMSDWSFSLYILSKKVRPNDTLLPREYIRHTRIYLVSPTGWTPDYIGWKIQHAMDYGRFLSEVCHLASRLNDAAWNAWLKGIQRQGYHYPDECLRIYLCPDVKAMNCHVQTIATLVCQLSGMMSMAFPEVLWAGHHRYLPLGAWYTQELIEKKWCILVVPTFRPDIIPEIPRVHDQTVYRLMCTAKMSVHMEICLVSQIASATVVIPDRFENEHMRSELDLDTVQSMVQAI